MDQKNVWKEEWPPLNISVNANGSSDPPVLTAVEVILELKDWGEIRRLYAMN